MISQENTRNFLLNLYVQYPQMQLTDYLNALYQGTFGCKHLCHNSSTIINDIKNETFSTIQQTTIEPLDGNFSRVPFSILKTGLSATTFSKLSTLSSQQKAGSVSDLEERLKVLLQLIKENRLPFTESEVITQISTWKHAGYPAQHHSKQYRDAYHPAYRLLSNAYISYLPFLAEIDQLIQSSKSVHIAIEGGSASGKTTLASLLQEIYDCNVFHMDDFFLQPHQRTEQRLNEIGGNVDYERFFSEVMQPVLQNKTVSFRRFDCSTLTLGEITTMSPKQLTFIEGAYSMHSTLAQYYDFSVFLKINPQLQKKRIQKRNPPFLQEKFFNTWIPMEQRYFQYTEIERRCNMILEVTE